VSFHFMYEYYLCFHNVIFVWLGEIPLHFSRACRHATWLASKMQVTAVFIILISHQLSPCDTKVQVLSSITVNTAPCFVQTWSQRTIAWAMVPTLRLPQALLVPLFGHVSLHTRWRAPWRFRMSKAHTQ